MPTVRIFLLTYRRAHLLPRALDSLRAQTFTDWICEVHNDDPADTAPEAIVCAAQDTRLLYCRHATRWGAVAAFNHVYRGGPELYASLLEDDNWWDPTFLAEAVDALAAVPTAALVWANMRVWCEEADGAWTDTGRMVWGSSSAGAPPFRFELPEIMQSVDSLSSHGAMVFRPGCFRDRSVPTESPLAIIEPMRERAAAGPLLFLPQPLAHFAVTRSTARSQDPAFWLQCQLLLAASFFASVRTDAPELDRLWGAVRAQRPRATVLLFLAALVLKEKRLARPARGGDWAWFIASSLRHPFRLWRSLRFRREHAETWRWLLRQSEALGTGGRRAKATVVNKAAWVAAQPAD